MTGKTKNTWQSYSAPDVSTRGKRRKALAILIDDLERIRAAEEAYMDCIPLNLRESEACVNAEYTVDLLTDALITLGDAF
jgi:hypothetical protein